MVPMIRELGMTLKRAGIVKTAGDGNSMLTASILLGMMILPTIIGVTESAIRSVPNQYYEGALALGATHERSIFAVVLPAAKSGVVARNRTWNRACDRRDNGCHHGCRKSGENAGKYYEGCAYNDCEHCH